MNFEISVRSRMIYEYIIPMMNFWCSDDFPFDSEQRKGFGKFKSNPSYYCSNFPMQIFHFYRCVAGLAFSPLLAVSKSKNSNQTDLVPERGEAAADDLSQQYWVSLLLTRR